MKVALTGAGGRFGTAFQALGAHEVVPVPRAALADPAPFLAKHRPDLVLHAGAMTDVDACERDPQAAQEANVASTRRLAQACAKQGLRLVYISTDYVFDGERGGYRESHATNPLSVYGRTKRDGELEALAIDGSLVCRTAIVFGTLGRPDFISWLAGKIDGGEPFDLIAEQRASPTATADLVRQVDALVKKGVTGVVHTAGADALTRGEMATAVAGLLGKPERWRTVPFDKATWLARRPRDSSLDVSLARRHAQPQPFAAVTRDYLGGLGLLAGRPAA